MKLTDLFEFDPKIAGAAQSAASGIGRAADALKGPIPLGKIGQEVDNMRNAFNKYATQKQGDMTGVEIFTTFVDARKKKNPRDNINIDSAKLVGDDGKFNGQEIRNIFTAIAKAERKAAKADSKDTEVGQRARDRSAFARDEKGAKIPDLGDV